MLTCINNGDLVLGFYETEVVNPETKSPWLHGVLIYGNQINTVSQLEYMNSVGYNYGNYESKNYSKFCKFFKYKKKSCQNSFYCH